MNRVARQAIAGCERCDAAIFDPAQAAILRCGPQGPISIETKTGDGALTQPIRGRVRGTDLTILEIHHAPIDPECKPDSTSLRDV